MAKLEICAATIESALNAQNAGADRIELCTELSVGGITPSHGMIKLAKELLEIPIYVLIRPRGGDFNFSLLELEQMKEDVNFCAEEQVDGVVIGALTKDGLIHERMVTELLDVAGYMDVTFHRAFDEVANPFESLSTLIELGVQRILTSGGKGNAIDNLDVLGDLSDEAGEDLVIMPGGGIRPDNLGHILDLGVQEVHSSCLNAGERHTSIKEIKRMKALLE